MNVSQKASKEMKELKEKVDRAQEEERKNFLSKFKNEEIYFRFYNLLYRNSTIISVLASAFILFTGVVAINDISKAWVPLVMGLVSILVAITFSQAIYVVKASLSLILLIVISSLCYSFSYYFSYIDSYPGLYYSTILFTYLLMLTISYFAVRGKSRWGALNSSLIIASISSIFIGVGFLSSLWSSITFFITFSFVFYIHYYSLSNVRNRHMPKVGIDTYGIKEMLNQGEKLGYKISFFRTSIRNKRKGYFLASNGEYAYCLVPLYLDEALKLSIVSKKNLSLTYKNRVIDDFIIGLFYKMIPSMGTKRADISFVLLDMNQKNGDEAKIMATPLRDSKKNILSLIVPAASLTKEYKESDEDIFSQLEKSRSSFSIPLNDKQSIAINKLILKGDEIVSTMNLESSLKDEKSSDKG